MEGFGVAANAAGLISLGLSICHELLKFYSAWKEAEVDLKRMYGTVESLTRTLLCLNRSIRQPLLGKEVVTRVEETIAMCETGISSLQRKISKIQLTKDVNDGWKKKFKAQLHRASYPFKESTIIKLKEICDDLQDHLALALETLQM